MEAGEAQRASEIGQYKDALAAERVKAQRLVSERDAAVSKVSRRGLQLQSLWVVPAAAAVAVGSPCCSCKLRRGGQGGGGQGRGRG